MMKNARRLALVLLVFALTSCAKDAPQDFLEPEGAYAKKIDTLQKPVFIIAIFVALFVFGLVAFAMWKFRERPGDDHDELPHQLHGNTKLEIGWTILPALVLAAISAFTLPVIFDLADEPDEYLAVDVWGQKYWWGYEYPGEGNGQYGIESAGIRTANELHIPVGVPVYLTLRSNDVIHSFWAPKLNGKRDVVPGRTHHWKLEADVPGVYSGQCAEFCGTAHADMTFVVEAMDRAAYDEYIAAIAAGEDPPGGDTGDCGTTIQLAAVESLLYDTDAIEAPAGEDFCIEFTNNDSVPHDVGIIETDYNGDDVAPGESITYVVPAMEAGDYTFYCTLHPQAMVGDLTVTE